MSQQGVTDTVEETYHDYKVGVKVERVTRTTPEGEQKRLKVYRKVSEYHRSIETGERAESSRWVKIVELTDQQATETLFGLAKTHGYRLEGL